jgi:inosose dehydratase
MMANVWIGCVPITWRQGTPEEHVLAEIAQAGYAGASASSRGGTRSAAETVALFARFGLRPAPGYLAGDFWRAEREAEILERARVLAAFTRDTGCRELYLGAGGFQGYVAASGRNRAQVAGQVRPDDGLTEAELRQCAETLDRVGEVTLAAGVRSCLHNHVGSVIETGPEIERVLELVDPALVFLGPDTGHLAWAGVDPVDFCRRHAQRIKTIHVKDVHADVVLQGVEQGWDYDAFVDHGLFAELGEGCVDFPALFQVLRAAGFEGWVLAETDVTQKPTALESATTSRDYLKNEVGLR